MEPLGLGLSAVCGLVGAILLGIPVEAALLLTAAVGIGFVVGPFQSMQVCSQALFRAAYSETSGIILLYVLMGQLAHGTGLIRVAFNWFERLTRRYGLQPLAAVIPVSTLFAAMSGSSIAAATSIAAASHQHLGALGYRSESNASVIAAGGTLGFLIPPSLGFIVYGVQWEQSIGRLFLSGIVPGAILACLFFAVAQFYSAPRALRDPRRESLDGSGKVGRTGDDPTISESDSLPIGVALLLALLPCTVVGGGLASGIATPFEAGALGALAMAAPAIALTRDGTVAVAGAVVAATRLSAKIVLLLAGAEAFGRLFALTGIADAASAALIGAALAPAAIYIVVLLTFLLLGTFLDAISMIVITMPLMAPILSNYGWDPIWFGVVSVMMMEAGLITPPLGLNVVAVAKVAEGDGLDFNIWRCYAESFPYLLCICGLVMVLYFFPSIAVWHSPQWPR